jgi:hypothetical protein
MNYREIFIRRFLHLQDFYNSLGIGKSLMLSK